MGIRDSLPMTGYIKMIDIWMIFAMSYPFVVISLHCLKEASEDRGTRRVNVKSSGDFQIYRSCGPFHFCVIAYFQEKVDFHLEKQVF